MEEVDREQIAASGDWVKRSAVVRSSVQQSTQSKRNHVRASRNNKHHTASVDSIDYDLSSSDEEHNKVLPAADNRDDDFDISIARDAGVSPAKTDISDAKTSDITKVSQVKETGGIMHELAPSVSASQHRLETRSDHLSQAASM